MKIVRHHANGRFDWLISEHQSVNPSREAISILSGKYKRFAFVHPVGTPTLVVAALGIRILLYNINGLCKTIMFLLRTFINDRS